MWERRDRRGQGGSGSPCVLGRPSTISSSHSIPCMIHHSNLHPCPFPGPNVVAIITVVVISNIERAGEGLVAGRHMERVCSWLHGTGCVHVHPPITSHSVTRAFKHHPHALVDRQPASVGGGRLFVTNVQSMWWLNDDERGQEYGGSRAIAEGVIVAVVSRWWVRLRLPLCWLYACLARLPM